MNPIVLAAIAISLVSLGTVAMASLASQQAVSSANLQKAILERDRLSEQVSAFISSVTPSGPDTTVATVKNTGTSTVTIDHCLVLSPSPPGGNLRPAATKVPGVSSSIVNPGSTLDITVPGTVTGDNIKCVTSKGTVLPVKLDAAGNDAAPDPNNYFDLYSISADVGIMTGASYSTGNVIPAGRPSDPPVTIPPGTLTYHIPVEATVTVSSVVARYDDGTSGTIVSGPRTYAPGQRIDIPVTKPIDSVEVGYVDPATSRQQSSFMVRPSQVSAIITTLASGPTTVDMDVSQRADKGSIKKADGSVIRDRGYVQTNAAHVNQLGYGGPGGRMSCSSGSVTITPLYQGVSGDDHVSKTDLSCKNGWETIYQDPVSTLNIKFKAPKPSFLLQIDYVVDVRGWTRDSDFEPKPFTALLTVNNGQRETTLRAVITELTESRGLYSSVQRVFETGTITLQIVGAIPGQDMAIPVDLKVHGDTRVALTTGSNTSFSGGMGIAGVLEINPSLSQ